MNQINVNTISTTTQCYSATEEAYEDEFSKGQVVEGIITEVSDKISITLSGKELQVSQSAVQDAKEGQVRTFEITDISNESIVLREVGNETEQSLSQGVKQTTVASGNTTFVGTINKKNQDESLSIVKEKVKKQLESAANSLSEEDYSQLSEGTTPLEEYNEDRFERALKRIKEQREFKRDHLDKEIDKKQEVREEVEESASATGSDKTKNIEQQLSDNNLPVTEANIAKVATAMELVSMAPQMSDQSKAYMIENNMSVTPENIYRSIYSGNSQNQSSSYGSYSESNVSFNEETWNELKGQVEELLGKDGIEVTEKTLDQAKWLLSNELTISEESLSTLSELNTLQSGMDEDAMIQLCIRGLSQGQDPKQTDLVKEQETLDCIQKAMQSVEMLSQIDDSAVDSLSEGEEVTLETLANASNSSIGKDATASTIKAITAKRQLEEVRLKLTMENSYRLYQQGIEVNTTELEELVTQLRNLEDSYYRNLNTELGADLSDEELAVLKATDQTVNGLKAVPNTVLGLTYEDRANITITELYEVGENEQASQKNKASSYETLMTAPRKDLGDSIKKAFKNVDNILDDLGLDQTESNERAVRILAYNQMDINEESITNMKSYDLQVNQLLENMTPEVAVTLIKNGTNPLNMPISELNEMVTDISSSMEATSEEKFSEYLYNLDKKNEITSEQRESYIGIYRLLHQVEKSDGAAVGSVVNAEKELTLGNLLTAVRSRQKEGMDVKVDETFGGIETASNGKTSISDQVNKAFYGNQLAADAFDGLTADSLMALESQGKDLSEVSLEELYEAVRDTEGTDSDAYMTEKYNTMVKILKEASYSDLLVSAGVDVSVNALQAADYVLSEKSTFFKDMRVKAKACGEEEERTLVAKFDSFMENLAEEESIEEGYEGLADSMDQVFETFMENDDVVTEDVRMLSLLQNGIRLAGEMSKSRMFEVPVMMGDEVVNMKVQMVPSKDGQAKVNIKIADEQWGTFDASAAVSENKLSAFVVCDNHEVVEYLSDNKETLAEELEETGLDVKQLNITMNRKKTEFYSETYGTDENTEVTNEMLYKIAKTFVSYAKKGSNV